MKIINDIMATRLLFFLMAFFVGLWTIRIPTIKDQINTDYFGIGLVWQHSLLDQLLPWFLQIT